MASPVTSYHEVPGLVVSRNTTDLYQPRLPIRLDAFTVHAGFDVAHAGAQKNLTGAIQRILFVRFGLSSFDLRNFSKTLLGFALGAQSL